MGGNIADSHFTIALAGNPNTGKSTIFNRLTGLRQHTGNWPGKTVERAEGAFAWQGETFRMVDLPGTYSLLSMSEDEEVARDFILFGKPDVTVIVVDATRIERNMNLTLQILEITPRSILCVNLIDEAERNKISIDLRALSRTLHIPVVGVSARSGRGIPELLNTIREVALQESAFEMNEIRIEPLLETEIQEKVSPIQDRLHELFPEMLPLRWIALRLIEGDEEIRHYLRGSISDHPQQARALEDLFCEASETAHQLRGNLHEVLTESYYRYAHRVCQSSISSLYGSHRSPIDIRIDRMVTHRVWGPIIMLLLLAGVFWLTIVGSNYPSSWLSSLLVEWLHPILQNVSQSMPFPQWLSGLFIDGVYLSTAWVVSVMLPPMAIFFPLFTLLEDFGYLPRVAFNLDELFRKAGAHGKQALTMTMGFGCNAAAVVSTRIIDSPRERLIAIVTNNFSLCNGRWPTQILIASLFIAPWVSKAWSSTISFLAVMGVALLGVGMMFLSSWGLSRTLLRGKVSTFNLELPPYRPPQFWRTLYSSLVNRTLVVLGRSILLAAPAGALIWISCNVFINQETLAEHLVHFLDQPGYWMGLNGVILLAYILAIPANEIVIPTIMMLTVLVSGNSQLGAEAGVLFADESMTPQIFALGGWTTLTGVNLMLFSLLHNPCSTTIMTIYKETRSIKWTAIATFLPLVIGIIVTTAVAFFVRL